MCCCDYRNDTHQHIKRMKIFIALTEDEKEMITIVANSIEEAAICASEYNPIFNITMIKEVEDSYYSDSDIDKATVIAETLTID